MTKRPLYLPLGKKEISFTWPLALIYIVGIMLLGVERLGWHSLLALVITSIAIFLTRDFWQETFRNLTLLGRRVWLRPVFATVFYLALTTFLYDIAMYYSAGYFVGSDWGPLLWNIRAYTLQNQELFWPVAIAMIFVMPIAEELIFRQLIFSTIHTKSNTLAIVLSVVLFTLFHSIGYSDIVNHLRMPVIGGVVLLADTFYLPIYAFQFIPMGLFLCWLYRSTDSIVSPIMMHMLCNAIVVHNAWVYLGN